MYTDAAHKLREKLNAHIKWHTFGMILNTVVDVQEGKKQSNK